MTEGLIKSGGEYVRYVSQQDQGRVGGPYPVKFYQGYMTPRGTKREYIEVFLRDGWVGSGTDGKGNLMEDAA